MALYPYIAQHWGFIKAGKYGVIHHIHPPRPIIPDDADPTGWALDPPYEQYFHLI